MESVNIQVTRLIQERDGVISERRHALIRWANAKDRQDQRRIYYEFVQPLGAELLKLNRRLGL